MDVGLFGVIVEELRDAVDQEGAKWCFKKSLDRYAAETGIDPDGLWAVVDGVLQNADPIKLLSRMEKSWGGTKEQWVKWYKIAKTRPDCPPLEPK